MNIDEHYAVEYSATHRLYSVLPLSSVLALNASSHDRRETTNFVPIAIFPSREEADAYRETIDPDDGSLSTASLESLEAVLERFDYNPSARASRFEIRIRQAIASKVPRSKEFEEWRARGPQRPTSGGS